MHKIDLSSKEHAVGSISARHGALGRCVRQVAAVGLLVPVGIKLSANACSAAEPTSCCTA